MQGDFVERDIGRGTAGYGSAVYVKEYNDQFFNLIVGDISDATSPSGENETFEFDSLLARTVSKIKGKRTLENVTVTFLWNRENVYRLDQLVGRTYEFMLLHKDYTYETFMGELTYKKNDTGAEANTGEYTIIPSSETGRGIDGRDFIRRTLEYAASIPSDVYLTSSKKTETIDISVKEADANAAYDVVVTGSANITAAATGNKLTITASDSMTNDAYAMVLVTAKSEAKMKTEGHTDEFRYAPWTMTIAVTYTA